MPRATPSRRDSSSTPGPGDVRQRGEQAAVEVVHAGHLARLLTARQRAECTASSRHRLTRPAPARSHRRHDDDRARPRPPTAARRPPPRLGLHRVLGGQRPDDGRASSCRRSASAARPTPGPRPGCGTKASYVLEQGDIRFVVSGALDADSPIAEHVRTHGDGVHDLAWLVDDATAAYDGRHRPRRPAASARPWTETDDDGDARAGPDRHLRRHRATPSSAAPATRGPILEPGYGDREPARPTPVGPEVGLDPRSTTSSATSRRASSTTGCASTPRSSASRQLVHFDDNQIAHRVLGAHVDGGVGRLEDRHADQRAGRRRARRARSRSTSSTYDGPGVQHIALRTDDIVATVQALRDRGVRFMTRARRRTTTTPRERLADFDLPWDELQRLNILADRDQDGYLLQIFTETITDRPTVFFEIIERRGANGLRRGQLQGAVRGHRARPGAARQPLTTAGCVILCP